MTSTRPKAKEQRRFGEVLVHRAKYQKIVERRPYPPGDHGKEKNYRSGRKSDYGRQLEEKQKLRFIYAVMERQMRRYFRIALRQQGETGKNLLVLLECRLDNLVFRAGFAATIWAARQMVSHGHIYVNGQRVDRPSYQVRVGEAISLKSTMHNNVHILQWLDEAATPPEYLTVNRENFSASLIRVPERREIPVPINEQLVVEFYNPRM